VHDVDTVLGVSITRIAAGLVLLEGRIPDGVTVDRDAIDLTGAHASMTDVMAAVLGIQGSVSAQGHRLRAVGVTWSADSEPKARELVTTLTEFGLTNIVAVRPAEATSTLIHNSQGADADGQAHVVDTGAVDAAVADSEVPLARGAALALARNATTQTEHDENPRRKRRRPDPSSIAAATILGGATLGVLAAMWIGVAPRHADTDVGPPAPQQRSAPPQLQVPPPAGVTAPPVAPVRPQTLTDASQGAAPVNTPTPPAPAVSHQLVPVQHLPQADLPHRPANPPQGGQDPAADDTQGPPQEPPVADAPLPQGPAPGPPGPGPAPEVQGAGPGDGTAH
jgi:hypothetical protein